MKKILLALLIIFIGSPLTCRKKRFYKRRKKAPVEIVYDKKFETLTIEDAVEQALKRKPSIHAYQYGVDDYRRQRKSTLSTFLPNVTLSESFYNAKQASKIRNSFSVDASQTIFNPAQNNYVKVYDAYVSSARHKKESHKDLIRLETETAFLNAWLLEQKKAFIDFFRMSTVEEFEKAKKQFLNNLLNKNDFLKAKATYEQNLATINSYQDEVNDATKTLKYYTNVPYQNLYWNPYEKFFLENINFYYQKAMKYRKDLKTKQDTIDSEKHLSKYYKSQYIPSVSLFGSASKTIYRKGACSTFNKSAGLKISWSAFDGLSNYFNKSAADARKMKAILEKNDLRAQIKLEVQKAYSAIETELRKLEAQTYSYDQAKNEFDLKKEEFASGLISFVDFQTSKYNHENARFTWFSQAATTAVKYQNLLYSCGYPA